jgi:hypothetical protein
MKKLIYIYAFFCLCALNLKAQDYTFPNFYQNTTLNDSICNYSFVLVGNCGGPVDYHTLLLTNNSGLAPIATSVNLQFVITKIVSFPSSSVFCTQTGTVPVIVGSVFKFTNANQQFAFTCTPGATVTGKFMVNGTPTIINEVVECGFHISLTLGSCNNNCMITGANKWLSQSPQCNVGIPSGLTKQSDNIQLKIYPNPSEGLIKVDGSLKSKNLSYEILNLSGQILQKANIKEFPAIIDITQLAQALYVLKIADNNQTIFQTKLQKK